MEDGLPAGVGAGSPVLVPQLLGVPWPVLGDPTDVASGEPAYCLHIRYSGKHFFKGTVSQKLRPVLLYII